MGASCIDAVSVLQGAHGGHERLAVDDPLHPPVVAPALVEDAEFADAALQPLRMSSERMHVEAWIAALDPVESRQGLRAVLGRETAKVVERSPRKGDGHRPLATDGGGGLLELCHQGVERGVRVGCRHGCFHPIEWHPLSCARSEFPVGLVEVRADKLSQSPCLGFLGRLEAYEHVGRRSEGGLGKLVN
jgi:hypothetical protein